MVTTKWLAKKKSLKDKDIPPPSYILKVIDSIVSCHCQPHPQFICQYCPEKSFRVNKMPHKFICGQKPSFMLQKRACGQQDLDQKCIGQWTRTNRNNPKQFHQLVLSLDSLLDSYLWVTR